MKLNRIDLSFFKDGSLKKCLRIMKLISFFILVLALQMSASVYSQTTTMSVKLKNSTLQELFLHIEKSSNYRFFYNNDEVDVNQRISVDAEEKTVGKILEVAFAGLPYSFKELENKLILIERNGAKPNPIGTTMQQQKSVSGKVTDSSGASLPGVSVVVKGTTNGTITDGNGNYSISNVPENAIVQFSFVGMKGQEMAVGGKSTINVSMEEDAIGIEEVVAIGYGVQKKRDVVGSMVSVTADKLENSGSSNVMQALQGSASGVLVQRSNGTPGSSGSIRIRGVNSIKASNSPLIVLDGIPYNGDIGDVNPNDIESIDILKDASASAIYGSKASNGVILITTKRGELGKPTIEFNVSTSFQTPSIKPNLQSADEYLAFKTEAYRAAGLSTEPISVLSTYEYDQYAKGETIDWYDAATQTGMLNEYQVGISGGNEKFKYYLSGALTDDKGLVIESGYQRSTLKANLENTITDWLTVGNNLLLSETKIDAAQSTGNMYNFSHYAKMFEDDGSYTFYPMSGDDFLTNVIADNKLTTSDRRGFHFTNNLYANINFPFIKGLTYRLNYGLDRDYDNNNNYYPKTIVRGKLVDGEATKSSDVRNVWTIENILKYNRTFGVHSFDLTGLYSRSSYESSGTDVSAKGFLSDDYLWHNLGAAVNPGVPASGYSESNLESYMFRLNYDFKKKYYLTATGRQDGYSAFGNDNKFSFFPSFALAWRLTEEQFLKSTKWIDNLKLRLSYGNTGNQSISPYSSLSKLRTADHVFGNISIAGIKPESLGNSKLKWETTNSLNLGLDYTILDGKISGAIDFYDSHTNDLLMNRSIPNMTGFSSVSSNIGKIRNRGVEIELFANLMEKSDFKWDINLNASFYKNEIVELYGDDKDDIGNKWFIGEPIGVMYDYQFDGIWQLDEETEAASYGRKPGDAKLKDISGPEGVPDGKYTSDDRMINGYPDPKWIGGITNSFQYKNFNLSVFVYTMQDFDQKLSIPYYNVARFRIFDINYWTPENASNEFARPNYKGMPASGSMGTYDASFWRIKDINLSYNIPTRLMQKIGINSVKIYANLHDYFLFTKFPLTDPEISASQVYPLNKSFQLGIKLKL